MKVILETEVPCTNCHGTGQVHEVVKSIQFDTRFTATCPMCKGTGKIIHLTKKLGK